MTEKPLKDKVIHVSLGVLIASTLWVVGIFLNIGEKIGIAKSGGTEWQQEIEEQVVLNESELRLRDSVDKDLQRGIVEIKDSMVELSTEVKKHIEISEGRYLEIYRSLGRLESKADSDYSLSGIIK